MRPAKINILGHFTIRRGLLNNTIFGLFVWFYLWSVPSSSYASDPPADTLHFCVMTYNVENLFDTKHDSLKDDLDFLPQSIRHWTYRRYRKKLDDVARVITAIGQWDFPALVALCEVENDSVLYDLTKKSLLRRARYKYIITHSADSRGIDVALLYQPRVFRPIQIRTLRLSELHTKESPTRDILHVTGRVVGADTLDVFVAHFPSRRSGKRYTAPRRIRLANLIKRNVDSLYHKRRRAQIIIMGDLNDEPDDRSIAQGLSAQELPAYPTQIQPHRLYNLLARKTRHHKIKSYRYQEHWHLFDHIIVSGTLLQPDALLSLQEQHANIYAPSFLLKRDDNYGHLQPYSTYYGFKYQGGYSDHLPVYADFILTIRP